MCTSKTMYVPHSEHEITGANRTAWEYVFHLHFVMSAHVALTGEWSSRHAVARERQIDHHIEHTQLKCAMMLRM